VLVVAVAVGHSGGAGSHKVVTARLSLTK
jgi:hypothetical protein